MSEKQFYLLQVNDALFPIGGYSHSQGLETYIQRGIVHNVDTAREYITHKIKWNLAYTELLAARLAYEAAEKKDLQELLYLEELLEASRIPMEQREAARKMGSRFAKTIEKLGLSISETGIFREYLDARKGKAVNHCCIYGVFCAEMQIPLEEALTHYLYAQTSAIVTNCVIPNSSYDIYSLEYNFSCWIPLISNPGAERHKSSSLLFMTSFNISSNSP